ncbi:unnamed protein product [Bursaphelenchus okinawaensis]|uniref:Uncharacterized protein n=1 Tax=Bursaphelenchus okinawaensis TaxID=465554 RepID=A0A811K9M5_9BILA|nr:unnamed protein product [Bursaphelenchus okinawaensis]CAG9094089.1 unnamed protein product [Bursaphelenchus okinawaensis]
MDHNIEANIQLGERFDEFCKHYIRSTSKISDLMRLRTVSKRGAVWVYRLVCEINVIVHERYVEIYSGPTSKFKFASKNGSFFEFVDFVMHNHCILVGLDASGFVNPFDYVAGCRYDYKCTKYLPEPRINNVTVIVAVLSCRLSRARVPPEVVVQYEGYSNPIDLPPLVFEELIIDMSRHSRLIGSIDHHEVERLVLELNPYLSSGYSVAQSIKAGTVLSSSLKHLTLFMKMNSDCYVYNGANVLKGMVDILEARGVRLASLTVKLHETACATVRQNFTHWMFKTLMLDLDQLLSYPLQITFEVKLKVKLAGPWGLPQTAGAHLSLISSNSTLQSVNAKLLPRYTTFKHQKYNLTTDFSIEAV